jgi:exonuclease SbcC
MSALGHEEDYKEDLDNLIKEHKTVDALVKTAKSLLEKKRLIADRQQSDREQLKKQFLEISRLQSELQQKQDYIQERTAEHDNYAMHIDLEDTIRKGNAEWQISSETLTSMNSAAIEYHKLSAEWQTVKAQMDSARKILQNNIDSLTKRESEIAELQQHCDTLSKQIEGYKQTITVREEELKVRAKLEKELQELESKELKNVTETTQLQNNVDELNARIRAIKESQKAVCPTCDKPLSDSERKRIIHDIEENRSWYTDALTKHKDSYADYVAKIREIEEKLLTAEDKNATLVMYRRNLDVTSERLAQAQIEIKEWESNDGAVTLQALQSKLENDEYAPEEKKRLIKIEQNIEKLDYDEEAHKLVKISEEGLRHYQEEFNALEKAKSALVPLEREIKNLKKSYEEAKEHLSKLESEYEITSNKLTSDDNEDIEEIEAEYQEAQDKADELLKQIGYAKSLVDSLEEMMSKKSIEEKKREDVIYKISQLKILEKAFGKDGIPTLLIEQALPDIEAHANEVLDRLSNGTMQLSFETQRDFKDVNRKDRKETLDIMISSSSEERAYELLSGGEAFRINFAIRLALSHILANRSGARLSTLVIDEGFGSQDAEGRQRLIEAINSVRDDFAKILVITHLEELKDAFSTRIEVSKHSTGSQVQVVLA